MSCVSQEDALLPHVAKKKRATKFKAMASAGCSARARKSCWFARASVGSPKLPRTGCGACPDVPCVHCSAARPLASDSRPLVSLFMFLHTQKIHTAPVLSLRARASARRAEETLGEGNLEQSVLPTVRKRSQTSSRPSQVLARWGTNAPFI